MFGRYAPIVVACFCLFALASTVRPLESLALSERPSATTRYQELTRHAVEDVDGESLSARVPAVVETGWPILQIATAPRLSLDRRISQVEPVRRLLIGRRIAHAPDPAH
jgi:hypothetical protein